MSKRSRVNYYEQGQVFNWDIPLFLGHFAPSEPLAKIDSPVLRLCPSDADWRASERRNWFRWDQDYFAGQTCELGTTGSGKTVTLLSIAFQVALQWGWPVHFITAKNDPSIRREFVQAMSMVGRTVSLFPQTPYDFWRGDHLDILNRLLAVQEYTDPYYQNWALGRLNTVVSSGPIKSSQQFLARLRQITDPKSQEDRGLLARYEGFFAAVGNSFDGNWAIEDEDATYFALDSTGRPETANQQANGLLMDMIAGFGRRGNTHPFLIIFDEFGAAPSAAALSLVERGRSFGANCILSAQSYEGLGPTPEFRQRIWAGSNTQILHRVADPQTALAVAATSLVEERSEQWADGWGGPHLLGSGSLRMQHSYRVHPNQIRAFATGEALFIRRGACARALISPWGNTVPPWWWRGDPISGNVEGDPPAPPFFNGPNPEAQFEKLCDLRAPWEKKWADHNRMLAAGQKTR